MIECNVCGKEFENARAFHGHLIRWHAEEYKESENDDHSFYVKEIEMAEKKKAAKQDPDKPKGFRLLKRADADENEAYKAGYRYIDDEENCYTHEEAKEEGWI